MSLWETTCCVNDLEFMRFHRSQRISSLIKEELSKFFLREFEFEGAVVTILDVLVLDKLEEATVKISVYPSEKGPDVFFKLTKNRRRLQFAMSRKLNIRPMPRLVFELEKESVFD